MIQLPPDWRMIFPGCYVDADANGHLYPTEAIKGLQIKFPKAGFDFTRRDFDMVVEVFSQHLEKVKPHGRLYSKLTVHRSEEDERAAFSS